jgi:hypothetical protein
VVAATNASIGGVKAVADLKLSLLPNQTPARIAIDIPEALKEELDAFAAEHGWRHNRPGKTSELMPEFLGRDHGWRGYAKQMGQLQTCRD